MRKRLIYVYVHIVLNLAISILIIHIMEIGQTRVMDKDVHSIIVQISEMGMNRM